MSTRVMRLVAVLTLVAFLLVMFVGLVGCSKKTEQKAGGTATTTPKPPANEGTKAAPQPVQPKMPPPGK